MNDRRARYDAEHTRQIVLKLNRRTDADVLRKLDEQPNKQGYIKQLVRADIQSSTISNENYTK